jgi:Kef-type K+ transport system membrane component KefB
MNALLVVGIILSAGFILGREMQRLKMPKIMGYLLAGVILNPQICRFVPPDITHATNGIENIAIAFIAFAIGGTIVFKDLKKLGKGMLYITIFEAQITFLAITAGFMLILPFVPGLPQGIWFTAFLPAALLLGCLGCPTDPSVALALTHEYKAKGEVTTTILGVAAFDDVLGIINYSVAVVLAQVLISRQQFSAFSAFVVPFLIIAGSVVLGVIMGLAFNLITSRFTKETEGAYFVLIISFLTLCWGLATFTGAEEILSIMVLGIFVANYNPKPEKIFSMLERYSEELIFLIFFTLSGMHLDMGASKVALILLGFFVVFRIIGKFLGTAIGAGIAHSSPNIKKYAASGFIPYGGVVIGLALIMQQNPVFSHISGFLVNTIIGATIINEFMGPIFLKKALKDSGEIKV